MTYFWIKGQLDAEVAAQGQNAMGKYQSSQIVQCQAPTELGTLRPADGQEGFDAKE